MARKSLIDSITVDFTFAVFAATVILLLPLKLSFSWFLAVLVHECSHYFALKLCGVPIYGIHFKRFGVIMDSAPLMEKQEFICALAGPLGGLSLLFFACWLPCTAICAFVQSIFNLLPIFPFDGGRVLRCILVKILGTSSGVKISKIIHTLTIILLGGLLLYIAWRFDINRLTVFLIELIVFLSMNRKLPCKRRKLIVQ